jgi:hypothetical protein
MAVSFNSGIYTKTAAGYYAAFDAQQIEKPVTVAGYLAAGSFSSAFPIVDLDPVSPLMRA